MSWNGVKQQSLKAEIEAIEAWCEEMEIENYTINSKGEIDVGRSVDLDYKDFKELPYKFGRVNGYFDIGNNPNLTSLKNCPNYVTELFACNKCPQLDSLEGCPTEVGRRFYCYGCKREFTEEEVKSLCKVGKEVINLN